VDVVITTNNQKIKFLKVMSKDLLFAIDTNTKEVIVSDSSKVNNKIKFIERIRQSDNDMFFNAVLTLTSITRSSNFDATLFKSMDKVCQMIYNKHKETI
jgi:hypothetical protein|tara:strand:+ start:965 stop:1261 length:297 start_codon:yes stop_codon:yes gene_type:complete